MKETLKGDERLIKHLVPDFPMGCRRLGPAEGFLECLQEPHVTMADSNIVSFTDRGILTDKGEEIDVDVIICATGFDVSFRPYFPIIGRNGTSLADHWKVDPEAYFAIAADGFPNFLCEILH
jgi:cation diffusion facilitator CzcD-associated flavoprotein CzcO